MDSVWQSVASVCVVLAAAELAGRLCSKNAMVQFVRALAVLVLLVSAVSSLFSLDWELSRPAQQSEELGRELTGLVREETKDAAAREAESYLKGLLAVAGMEAEKIQAFTDIGEDGRIVLTKVTVAFSYESDAERAFALLKNTVGEETRLEVQTDGR